MTEAFSARSRCALCRTGEGQLEQVCALAATPPANEFISKEQLGREQELLPLTLVLCSGCGHLQLSEIVNPNRLFGNYVYVSGTSPVFVAHFERYAASAIEKYGLVPSSFVLDVGSNDGTLLRQFQQKGIKKVLGVDPAADIARSARESGVPTIESFFQPTLAMSLLAEYGPASLICANNVFAHTDDLAAFTNGVRILLQSEGVFVFEVSYLVDVVEKLLFDTIYHEHSSYHALSPLVSFFEARGLRVFDCERLDTHGGSLRCSVCPIESRRPRSPVIDELIRREQAMQLFSPGTFEGFKARIVRRGSELRGKLTQLRDRGAKIAGFGAPAKLTTLMYEFGLGRDTIDFVVDDSPWKQGLYTPGTHIPVVPSSELYRIQPEWCVIFAWNFADAVIAKHRPYTAQGGKFLVPMPELRETP